MAELDASFEVIFIEDSGDKNSWNELLRIKNIYKEDVKIVKLTRNFGQNGATICGIDLSRGDQVITIDDDLHTHPKEIKKLVEKQKETNGDVIYGAYTKKQSALRINLSKLVRYIFTNSEGGSTLGSSFRLIDKHIVERLKFHSQDHLFINQIMNWYTLNQKFVEVENSDLLEEKSRYTLWQLALISFKLVFYYTNIPLKITIYSCLLSLVGCTYFAWHFWRIITPIDTEIEVTTIVLFMGLFLIISSITVLAVYINRIYNSRVKKPNYAIKLHL
jgi:glycosyltransferase involved in cell wall biosynthesis